MDISWIRPEQLIEFEFTQLKDEGIQVDELQHKWDEIKKNNNDPVKVRNKARILLDKMESFKKDISNENIKLFLKELRGSKKEIHSTYRGEDLYNKISGGWNGRAAGCLLGKPVEKYRRDVIKEILMSNKSYPLNNYITGKGIPQELLSKYPWNRHDGKESLRENILCMTEDDDMNYAMLNLYALEKYGKDFTTENIAETWLDILPALSTFTAERAAYNNLLRLMDISEVPVYHNPYREWIGAMIRADIWGWVSPGNPLQAAELAFRDASLTHTRDGVYGAMFIASTLSLSFTVDKPGEALKGALNYIPSGSRTAKAVEFGMSIAHQIKSWESVLDVLLDEYRRYFWVHSVNNMALIAAALVHGNGNYEDSICRTVMAGLDTDSTGATVGAIAGTIIGFDRLPSKWIASLNNKIRSSLKGFDNLAISNLAERTYKLNNKFYEEIK